MPVITNIIGGSAGESAKASVGWTRVTGSRARENKQLLPLANVNSRVTNRRYLLEFQSWRSKHDKFDLVTADLKQGNSKLAYPPAALVLKALVDLFTVVAKDGPLKFKHPYKFTKEDHLITSLFEIAGKVMVLSGRDISQRVVQKALLLLHRGGIIYKTRGFYGNTQQCRMFGDLKGYVLCKKLEHGIYGCPEWYAAQTKRFPVAEEGEYGYGRKLALPSTPEGADYIKGYNPGDDIDREQTSPITVQNNTEDLIVPLKTENVPLARPLSLFKEPGKEENITSPVTGEKWVEFTLTPQVQKILAFIQSNKVFLDEAGEYRSLDRITAQEASALIGCVQSAGLTLSFLKRYARLIERSSVEPWFMKTRLGFFCDHFYVIKKLFYLQEASENLQSVHLAPSGNIVDVDYYADIFVGDAMFRFDYCENPADYRVFMRLRPDIRDDDGRESACTVIRALRAPNILPEDREFIIGEHRPLARRWFINNPQEYLGVKKMGVDISKVLLIEDDKPLLATLEKQYVQVKSYLDRYRDQFAKANQDLSVIKKYQGDE